MTVVANPFPPPYLPSMKGTRHHRAQTPRNRDTGWNLGPRKPRCRNTGARSGQRFYSPELGRWTRRDPLNLRSPTLRPRPGWAWAFDFPYVSNAPISLIDPFGLEVATAAWRASSCSCDEKKVNQAGCAAAKEAYQMGEELKAQYVGNDTIVVASPPEFCGRVCCNRNTGEVTQMPIVKGPWLCQKSQDADGKTRWYCGVGAHSCNPELARPCKSLGQGWEDAAYFHSHPNDPAFSREDRDYIKGRAVPLFMGHKESCRALDPMRGRVDFPPHGHGVGAIEPWEYIVDPVTGEVKRVVTVLRGTEYRRLDRRPQP